MRERLLACKMHEINTIVVPETNKPLIENYPVEFLNGLKILYAKTLSDVYEFAFTDNIPKEKCFSINMITEVKKDLAAVDNFLDTLFA